MRNLLGVAAVAVGFCLTGCGGGGAGSVVAPATVSAFAGEWQGTWSDDHGYFGTIIARVGPTGSMSVSLTEQSVGAYGSGDGKIDGSGKFSLSYEWDPSQPLVGAGALSRLPTGEMSGPLVSRHDGKVVSNATMTIHKAGN